MDGSGSIYLLNGVVQHYSWGGYDFIPGILGIQNTEKKPFAEYWLGAHPNHPSTVLDNGNKINLDVFTDRHDLNTLPYLLKILDVRQMLSIQVHPDRQSAKKGFDEENTKGIALNAQHRNYKDKNHKPELMVALSDFWLLHGFKKEEEIVNTLHSIPEFNFLIPVFNDGNYKQLYETIMTMPQQQVNEILRPLAKRILPDYENGNLHKDDPGFWAARAIITFCQDENYDRGILSIYLFNLLHIKKGEGLFQHAGVPHAYLEGQNIEVMANSDNVLRAGLTDKHIDIGELMKQTRFEATTPVIIQSHSEIHHLFAPPVEEFELHQYELKKDEKIKSTAAEIWLLTEGWISIDGVHITNGQAVFVKPGKEIMLHPLQPSVLFRVTVPGGKN